MNRGQNYYIERYNKVWNNQLSGQKRSRVDEIMLSALENHKINKRGRKRVKFSNQEICIEAHPHLREYAKQRSLEFQGATFIENDLH